MSIRRSPSAGRSKVLVFAAVFAVAALVGGALAPSPSEAGTRCGTEFQYYSDATYTELVGVRGWLPEECGCQFYTWGSLSVYKLTEDSWC